MEELYYTPKIEELFVGYQCETWYSFDRQLFEKTIIDDQWQLSFLKEYLDAGSLRTKYLDKQDIESEGWISHAVINNCWYREDITNKGVLYLTKENEYITIEDDRNSEFLFKGKIKSINEFKKIIEWTYL